MARRPRAGRDAAKEERTDEIYNARRRAKRSLERLDRDIKAGKVKNTRQVRAYRAEIMRQISKSYQGKNPTDADVSEAQRAARSLGRYTVGARTNAVQRRNVMFRANMKAGSAGAGSLPKENVQLFWNATKHAWAGRGRDRYASIMSYYGTDDLQAIFNDVMRQNKEALRRAKGLSGAGIIADTADMSNPLQLAMGEGLEADGNYPNDFLAYTVPVYNVA
jgi:hypothetical protein